MQVTCPNCGARYAVDPLAIGPIGRTVQCARCNHRWREKAAVAAAAQSEPSSVLPRPTPDVMIRPAPPASALPVPRPQPPRTAWAGLWLSAAIVVIVLLGGAAYIWRAQIQGTLPAEWQTTSNVDAVNGPLKK